MSVTTLERRIDQGIILCNGELMSLCIKNNIDSTIYKLLSSRLSAVLGSK